MPVTILDTRPAETTATRATVLFVDLRGYTGLAEQLPAADLVPLLDEFFAVLTDGVVRHGGQVFHLAGDGMMAGFGTRHAGSAGAVEAITAAREMLDRFEPIAGRWRRVLSVETGIGIGIHLGEVAVARLGPPGREAATLLGDTVNVAARLCSRARAGEILFSALVAAALKGERDDVVSIDGLDGCLRLPSFQVRGRSAPLDIWCLPANGRLLT